MEVACNWTGRLALSLPASILPGSICIKGRARALPVLLECVNFRSFQYNQAKPLTHRRFPHAMMFVQNLFLIHSYLFANLSARERISSLPDGWYNTPPAIIIVMSQCCYTNHQTRSERCSPADRLANKSEWTKNATLYFIEVLKEYLACGM